ncbi:MAG: helix-turn-helix domain-containing protein, partial [Desulfobulbaceae bacterium]|nr:helix-turn-helix domain-containing protein [Desulfobulbaceae bacterium]
AHDNEAGGEIPAAGMAGLPLEEVEKAAIVQTLRETGGNKSEAARILGITRTTLNNKIRKYAIDMARIH